ncbi:MAG: hydroxyacylglutathione hydrolase [Pseudomonadales bacterium]|nr:hydroxyacylglutathione hydrolase [Pseudomonadales bacterium]
MLEVHQIPCLSDNYGYLIHDTDSDLTASIDTPEVGPINAALAQRGWSLTHILNTHHHFDHAGGNLELKQKWDCTIVGSRSDADRIPGIDIEVDDGDSFTFGSHQAQVFNVSGHTIGHIAYYFDQADALFCGDALFALGCGRLFEGTPEQMWHSLSKFIALPDSTAVYCAHEYTQSNALFALSVEPENQALVARSKEIDQLRAKGLPTVPSLIGLEKATNPFLRPASLDLQRNVGLEGAELVNVFAETRRRKDHF